MNVRACAMLIVLVALTAASQTAEAASGPRATIKLDEWYRDNSAVATVTLVQRGPDVVARVVLRPLLRGALPMTMRLYGGQTPDISWPKTDCDVVYNNAMTSLLDRKRPDRYVSIRRNLGQISALTAQKVIRGTTLKQLRQNADAIAVWRWGSVFACGDI